MWKILTGINKNLVVAIPAMMLAGFFFGVVVHAESVQKLKSFIMPLTILMVYPMMVTLNITHLKKGLDVPLQLTTQVLNFVIIPLFAYFLGRVFFDNQPYMALGLLLAALLPTSSMTISWTGFAKGNVGAAISMTVIGLSLGSLITPFYVKIFLGATVQVNVASVMQQILLIVFLPMAAGFITRQVFLKKYTLAEFKEKIGPRFPPIATIGVLGIVFVAMALKSKSIMADPGLLISIFIPLLLLYAFNFTLSTLVGRRFFTRGDGIALVYGTVMRNLSIALAIAINAFGSEGANAALVIALAYIIQVQSAAWYVKFTDALFGKTAV